VEKEEEELEEDADEDRYDEEEAEGVEELESSRLSNLIIKLIPYHVMEFLCRISTRMRATLHNIRPETIE
jgi:hypothetical protein